MIRKAVQSDIEGIETLLSAVHDAEEAGLTTTGWKRAIYPIRATAEAALSRDDLYVLEEDGAILGMGVINQLQVDVYAGAPWRYPAPDEKVMVLHTLAIHPAARGGGRATAFVRYYEVCDRAHGCRYLRIDTHERNTAARRLYHKLGFEEISVAPCTFNGLEGIRLMLLEKRLEG